MSFLSSIFHIQHLLANFYYSWSFKQIDQERRGEQIHRALLKYVIDIFVEIGSGEMDYYENDFEAEMLKDTKAYYSRKASNLILVESCPNYMLKVLPVHIFVNIHFSYSMLDPCFFY